MRFQFFYDFQSFWMETFWSHGRKMLIHSEQPPLTCTIFYLKTEKDSRMDVEIKRTYYAIADILKKLEKL